LVVEIQLGSRQELAAVPQQQQQQQQQWQQWLRLAAAKRISLYLCWRLLSSGHYKLLLL
jgi:hypothetical protein